MTDFATVQPAILDGDITTMPAPTSTPDTTTKPVPTDGGDHDKYAHYVKKDKITESAITGKAVRAICGKKWVPTRKPDDFPVCPDCKRIYEQLKPSKS